MLKQVFRFTAILLFMAISFPLFAEEEVIREMKMISIAFNMDNLTPANAELRAGLDLEGFLLLGILWDLGFTTEGGDSATELAVGVWTSANLLSEENGLPISFGVSGDFRKMRTLSTYLDTNDLVKSGSGYKIGAVLSKNFPINETSSLDLALDGFYQFDTYTLEARAGSGITFETQISPYTNYTYGITATYVNVLAEDIAISYRLAIHLDKNLRFIYGPGFGFNAR